MINISGTVFLTITVRAVLLDVSIFLSPLFFAPVAPEVTVLLLLLALQTLVVVVVGEPVPDGAVADVGAVGNHRLNLQHLGQVVPVRDVTYMHSNMQKKRERK